MKDSSIVLSHFRGFLQLIRAFMSIVLGLSAIAGAHLAKSEVGAPTLLLLFLIGFATAAGGFACNDVQDQDRDRSWESKPLVRGELSVRFAVTVTVAMFLFAVVLSAILGYAWLSLTALQITVLCLYSRAKRINGLLANCLTALLCASGLLYGGFAGTPSLPLIGTMFASALFVLGREVLKDLLDKSDDAMAGIRTLATLWKHRSAAVLAFLMILSGSSICLLSLPNEHSGLRLIVICPVFAAAIWTTARTIRGYELKSLRTALDVTAFAMLSLTLILSTPT